MSKIAIGVNGDGAAIWMDLGTLISTRLLIQANSGGGKSWAIRRIVEQAFGKIQIIIVDPEGEFPTLREKYGFVLAGKDGDTPADVRSAALLAEKLLELQASAICDIYELKAAQRHQWVKAFLEAMINAPKKLWHPCLVVVDEAHVFCPEKGQGESEAQGAMTDLCTRGRKRGFCPVFATQRLGKLSKNASAELQNRLIGPTFEDIDRKRAADLLGVLKSDERGFFHEIQLLEPGNFFALGRAIALERVLLKVGPVATSHPQAGARVTAPPPAPESIARLLPQLSDLPKQAEERARSEQELRARIRELEGQVRQLDSQLVKATADRAAQLTEEVLARKMTAAIEPFRQQFHRIGVLAKGALESQEAAKRQLDTLGERIRAIAELHLPEALPAPAADALATTVPREGRATPVAPAGRSDSSLLRPARPLSMVPRHTAADGNGDERLSSSQQKILTALGEFEAIGRTEPSRSWLAFVAGVSPRSSGFEKNLSTLRTRGLIDYPGADLVQLTGDGRALLPAIGFAAEPLDSSELLDRVCRMLSGPQARLLEILVQKYPQALAREDLALAAGVSPLSSGFEKNVSTLSSRELATYPAAGAVKAAEWLFV